MKIGFELICETLKQNFNVLYKKIKNRGQEYCFPEIFRETSPHKNCICLVTANNITEDLIHRKDLLLVCVGHNDNLLQSDCQYIMLDDHAEMINIFSELAEIYSQISNWKESVHEICMQNGQLQDILDISATVFGKNMLYLNKRFEVLAYAVPEGKLKDSDEEYSEWLNDQNKDNLKELSVNLNDLRKMSTKKAPYVFHYTANDEDLKYLCASIKEDSQGNGYVAINIGNDYATSSQLWLIECLRKYLEQYFMNILLMDQSHQSNVQGILYAIISGTPLDLQSTKEKLNHLGSSVNDSYLCGVIALENPSLQGVPIIYLCSKIEQIWGSSYTIQYNTHIAVIINLTRSEYNFDETMSEFSSLLKKNSLKAGISNEFDDIFKVKSFFLQAEKAYETGLETDPSNSIYHFKDYAVPYILAQYGNELPLEMICCEGLMRLREYEKDSSVEYFKTLITYMRNNMNAIKTAKDLYIHRSTMLFRLNRIKEILQMDLNDPDQRLYLEISLRLIGKN